jgi:hypothetical protein
MKAWTEWKIPKPRRRLQTNPPAQFMKAGMECSVSNFARCKRAGSSVAKWWPRNVSSAMMAAPLTKKRLLTALA